MHAYMHALSLYVHVCRLSIYVCMYVLYIIRLQLEPPQLWSTCDGCQGFDYGNALSRHNSNPQESLFQFCGFWFYWILCLRNSTGYITKTSLNLRSWCIIVLRAWLLLIQGAVGYVLVHSRRFLHSASQADQVFPTSRTSRGPEQKFRWYRSISLEQGA